MFNFIKDVCEKVGPRLAFSKKEKEGAEYIEKEFKKYCDETQTEKFQARTGPFQLDFRLTAFFYVTAAFLYLFTPWSQHLERENSLCFWHGQGITERDWKNTSPGRN